MWFKVDDGFWSHPKVLELSDAAQALWLRAGTWSMCHMTDGFIPASAVTILRGKPRHFDELTKFLMLERVQGGWRFRDWESYQPTKADVEEKREKERLEKQNQRRGPRGQYEDSPKVSRGDNLREYQPSRPDPTITTTDVVVNTSSPAAPATVSKRAEHEREFQEQFWPIYPKKVGKQDALKAFLKARSSTDLQSILDGVNRYVAQGFEDSRLIKHPQGWLNGRRWEDEVASNVLSTRPSSGSSRELNARSTFDHIGQMAWPFEEAS